jgi:hypothetical protein
MLLLPVICWICCGVLLSLALAGPAAYSPVQAELVKAIQKALGGSVANAPCAPCVALLSKWAWYRKTMRGLSFGLAGGKKENGQPHSKSCSGNLPISAGRFAR